MGLVIHANLALSFLTPVISRLSHQRRSWIGSRRTEPEIDRLEHDCMVIVIDILKRRHVRVVFHIPNAAHVNRTQRP